MFKKNTKIKNFKKKHFIAQKKYDNPFFRHKIKKKSDDLSIFSLKRKVIAFFIFLILLVTGITMTYSSIFKVKSININIQAQNEISTLRASDLKNAVSNLLTTRIVLFPKDNLLLLDKNKLAIDLKELYIFDFLEITKDYPNSLNINIKEVEYAVIWSEKEKFYYSSPQGRIIKEVAHIEIKNIFPSIYNNGPELISNGWIESREQLITFVIKIHNKIKDEANLQIDRFEIDPNSSKSIKVHLLKGPMLLFDVEKDINNQFEKLIIVKNERLKTSFFDKQYIDLRYGDMIYMQ